MIPSEEDTVSNDAGSLAGNSRDDPGRAGRGIDKAIRPEVLDGHNTGRNAIIRETD